MSDASFARTEARHFDIDGKHTFAAGLIFLSIEGLQELLLPTSFAHGFALSDIWTSLAGGLTGSVAAVLRMSRTRNLGVKF